MEESIKSQKGSLKNPRQTEVECYSLQNSELMSHSQTSRLLIALSWVRISSWSIAGFLAISIVWTWTTRLSRNITDNKVHSRWNSILKRFKHFRNKTKYWHNETSQNKKIYETSPSIYKYFVVNLLGFTSRLYTNSSCNIHEYKITVITLAFN